MERATFFSAVVIYLISTTYCMSVRRCTAPECQQITVDAKEVRDVYVTDCNINRVTVIGDAARVFIYPLKSSNDQGDLCEPFQVIHLSLSTTQHDVPTHPTTQHDVPTHPATQYDVTTHPTTQYHMTTDPTTQHDVPIHPTTQFDMITHPTTQYDMTTHPTTQHDVTTHPTTRHDMTTHPTTQHDVPTHPTTRHDVTSHQTTKHDVTTSPSRSKMKHTALYSLEEAAKEEDAYSFWNPEMKGAMPCQTLFKGGRPVQNCQGHGLWVSSDIIPFNLRHDLWLQLSLFTDGLDMSPIRETSHNSKETQTSRRFISADIEASQKDEIVQCEWGNAPLRRVDCSKCRSERNLCPSCRRCRRLRVRRGESRSPPKIPMTVRKRSPSPSATPAPLRPAVPPFHRIERAGVQWNGFVKNGDDHGGDFDSATETSPPHTRSL
ncbi:uncharacterized protein LOC134272472, partial [Saccostrea cucullata]|uniref:uncharacterized protein LOC134272472 n=1 Tax=Saccostrea cuccullata TaxID=36930 RepID=UPI002ED63E6E